MNNFRNEVKRAAKYLDAATSSQEQLWKRRQIEWRTSFGLWTAMAVGTGFAYMHVSRPVPASTRLPIVVVAALVYAGATFFHFRHLKAIFISNEMDLDFLNYYKNRAEWELDKDSLPKPERPDWAGKKNDKIWRKQYYQQKKDKMTYLKTALGITILIAFLSIGLFSLIVMEEGKGKHPAEKKQIVEQIEDEPKIKSKITEVCGEKQ